MTADELATIATLTNVVACCINVAMAIRNAEHYATAARMARDNAELAEKLVETAAKFGYVMLRNRN